MRTDCIIDGRAIVCRNASTIGFSTVTLRVGMQFVYYERGHYRIARMLGRIKSAPDLSGGAPLRNYILAMVLSECGTHAYERWIDPLSVTETIPEPSAALAAFFFAPRLPYDVHTMRRLMEHGTVSNSYVHNAPAHVARWRGIST